MRSLPAILVLGASLVLAQSEWTRLRTISLRADTHHVQGVVVDGNSAWATSVNKDGRKGYLQEFSIATGELVRSAEVTDGIRFHPGGLSGDGGSLWLPVAEYRRASTSIIQKRNARTLELESQFPVEDHIGCVTVAPDAVIGANWDSREFYFWDRTGRLLRKLSNPTSNAYQEIKFAGGRLAASGLLPDHSGAVDWLDYPSLRLIRREVVGKTDRGRPYSSEGMAVYKGRFFFLPEDSPSRLFEFRLTRPVN